VAVENSGTSSVLPNEDVRFKYVEWDLGRGQLMPRLQIIAIV